MKRGLVSVVAISALVTLASAPACGSRSGLEIADAAPPSYECLLDSDCAKLDACRPVGCVAAQCVALTPVSCDDHDPCTADSCDPKTGGCVYSGAALDRDGDGVKGPAPGQSWTDQGACGRDCDDTDARAFPGNAEVCDGVDNDCNGIVDDGAIYTPPAALPPVLVSDASLPLATASSLARSPKSGGYLASYTGQGDGGHTKVTVRRLGDDGVPLASSVPVNLTLGDAEGGPLAWTGDRYGLAWSDRRLGNYTIWFAPLGPQGEKLGPDVQVSTGADFSINPALAWDGTSFLVVWQDRRSGSFAVWGRRLADDGTPQGAETLIADEDDAEGPTIAASSLGAVVVYRRGGVMESSIVARSLGPSLSAVGAPKSLDIHGHYAEPNVVRSGERFFASWVDADPQHHLRAAILDVDAGAVVGPQSLSLPTGDSRAPRAIGLGDRALVVYGRTLPATGYDVWARTFDAKLAPMGDAVALTSSVGDELPDGVAFGHAGDIAVLFTGRIPATSGYKPAVELTRLACTGLVTAPLSRVGKAFGAGSSASASSRSRDRNSHATA